MIHVFLIGFLAGGDDPQVDLDRRLLQAWKEAGVEVAAPVDDYTFLRRLSIDLRGVIPTVDEVRAFAADPDRPRQVDAWLRSPEFARHWAELLTRDLLGPRYFNGETQAAGRALEGWLREALGKNMPYDRIARRLLTAKGPLHLDPAAGFVISMLGEGSQPGDAVVRISRFFLGTQIRCAQCHDHPFDTWQQSEFDELSAFFGRTQARLDYSKGEARMTGILVDGVLPEDEGRRVKDVAPVYKAFREGPRHGETRRKAFARLLVRDEQFILAAVNRAWGMLVGRGFVHPLDGFTAASRPSVRELFHQTARYFGREQFNLRLLLRWIVLSPAYARSSKGTEESSRAKRLFARAQVVPMRPGVLFDSLVRATGWKAEPGLREEFSRELRPAFENDEAAAADPEPTVSQALLLMNGWFVGEGTLPHDGNRLERLLDRERDPAKRIEELFLATLSRPPSADEKKRMLEHVSKRGEDGRGLSDVLWALVNSTEFVTRN